jgi:hypothetical protein
MGIQMKKMSVLMAMSVLAMNVAPALADHSCQSYAETVALRSMNSELTQEVAPEKLTDAEKAGLSQTVFLDKDGNESSTETGIYEVEMTVMEECLDALDITVATMKDSSGHESCKLIKVAPSQNTRDCG